VQPADLPDPGRFSLGWQVGKTVYLAGQAGTDSTGKLVGDNDMKLQSRQAFTRLDDILKQSGGNLSNLVRITIFTTDMQRASEIQQVQAEVFPTNPPAATLVQVGALARPGMLVEIEGIAVLD
jgi:enamine deaminase RidA (YjgF/YER057c/UK114 family)